MASKEPEQLRRGKKFHRKVQESWLRDAEGKVTIETQVTKPNGRPGRADIFVDPDTNVAAIAEIKATDWDSMTPGAVRRNVRRHVKQLLDYAEPQVDKGKSVSIGFIYSKKPSTLERLQLVEELFGKDGIPVVWDDESTEERRAGSDDSS